MTLLRGSPGPLSGARSRGSTHQRASCGRAQLKEATWPFLHPMDPSAMGKTTEVGCAAKKVAVRAEGVDILDPGDKG